MNLGVRQLSLASAAFFLLVFGIYVRTLSPAFHPDDSPETITAGVTLSIQHPPGYPLHSLLGRLAQLSLPGPAAFNINALSALCAALAMLLMAWCGRVLVGEAFPEAGKAGQLFPLGLGLLGALSEAVWFQATIAKGGIYSLNLALSFGTLYCVLRARRSLSLGDLALAGLFFGLGMANHWTSQVVLVPAFVMLLGEAAWRREGLAGLKALVPKLAWILLWVFPGLSLYLYVALRSKLSPVLQWGEPWTLEGFWWLFNRSQYASIEAVKTLAQFQWLLGRVAHVLMESFHPLGLLVLGLGWVLWLKRSLWLALGCLLMPLSLALAVCWKANPPPDSVWIIDPYLVPLHAWVALGAIGLFDLGKFGRFAFDAALVLAVACGVMHWRANDHADDFLGYDYVNNLFLSCPQNAVVFCEGDSNTAGPLFQRFVLGKRQDLALVAAVLSDYPWYLRGLAAHYPGLKVPPQPLGPPTNMGWIAQLNPDRPAVHTNSYTKTWVDSNTLLPRGLVLLRQKTAKGPWPAAQLTGSDPWPAYALRGVFKPYARAQEPLTVRLVTDNYLDAKARLGEQYMVSKAYEKAEAEFMAIGALKSKWSAPWVQAGNAAYYRGALVAAGGHWERAVAEDPKSAEALANLGLYHLNTKNYERALQLARQAVEIDPKLANAQSLLQEARLRVSGQAPPPPQPAKADPANEWAAKGDAAANAGKAQEALEAYRQAMALGLVNAGVHRNMAVMFAKLEDNENATASIRKAVVLEPKNAELHRYLGIFLFNQGDRPGGIKALQESARLDPKNAETRTLLEQAGASMQRVE